MPKGIYNRPSLVSQQFGELTVVALAAQNGKRIWKCLCSCGKFTNVSTARLKKKDTVSCGHLKKHYAWRGFEEISGSYWGSVRRNAKVRGIEFSISMDEAWDKFVAQERKCVYTGWPLLFAENVKFHPELQTASLDRIDSALGYVQGNVQWVHKTINLMKLDLSENYFLEACCAVAQQKRRSNEQQATHRMWGPQVCSLEHSLHSSDRRDFQGLEANRSGRWKRS